MGGCNSTNATVQPAPTAPLAVPTGLVSDEVIPLPADAVQRSCGLAFDIGSTMGKIIYRSKKEYKDGQPISAKKDAELGQVHYALFPRADVKGMIAYLKNNCDLTKNEEGDTIVYSTGIGGAEFRVEIEKGLNCKFVVVPETDCFVKGLVTLEKILPKEELFIPDSKEVQDEIAKLEADMGELVKKMFDNMENTKLPDESQTAIVKEEDRPRILVMAGSGTGVFQINEDQTCTMMSGLYTGGRFMYGLSSILSGENDFSKLIEMAKRADGKSCDNWTSDIISPDTASAEGADENMYDQCRDMEDLVFPFGKGITVRSEEMKKQDLVFSAFHTTAAIHAQEISTQARMVNAKAVYFAGNLFNSEIMRNLVTLANYKLSMVVPAKYEYYFLKNGGMYGALGAFLQTNKPEA